jgi:hypothetical protein
MNCTNWRPRLTRNAEPRGGARVQRHRRGNRARALDTLVALVASITLALAAVPACAAGGESSRFAFAVIGNAFGSSLGSEAAASKLIDAIGRDPRVSFIVYDGNLKGVGEACSDALYARRQALLDASRPPLIFVPGQYDWVTCSSAGPGGYDPAERLDQLRQTLFSDPSSLGQNPLPLTRESEVPRFRPYRENVRWQLGSTVFIALNVPDGNNHYLNAGGRNGEFEDRVIANGFWLEHAAEYAKRRNAHAIVVFVQGNPWSVERRERSERFGWLRFAHRPRDGYIEFRRSLTKLAQAFRGPVLVVHQDDAKLARGFEIDQPLRNEKGVTIANVTRIAVALRDPATQWLHVDVEAGRHPPLRIGVREVPKYLPPLPTQQAQPPLLPRDGQSPALPDMPEISSMPDVTEIPPGAQFPPPAPPPQPAPRWWSAPPQPFTAPAAPAAPAAPPGAGAVYRN